MILAQFIGMVIMFIPYMAVAVICKNVVDGLLGSLATASGMSPFELAMALVIPYLILVYCVFIRPVTNFFSNLRGGGERRPGEQQ